MRLTKNAPRIVAMLTSVVLAAACSGGSPTSPSALTKPSNSPSASTTANLAGAWTVTISASSICSQIPSAYRRRSYAATLTQSGPNVAVDLGGQVQLTAPFNGSIDGRSIQWFFGIFDRVAEAAAVSTAAFAATTVSPTSMSGEFSASYDYYDFATGRTSSCNAANHQISFTRR